MNFAQLLQPFENKWVALSSDYTKVVASGDTLDEVESQVDPADVRTVVFFKVPDFDAVFIPTAL